jgi:hypothetical protein
MVDMIFGSAAVSFCLVRIVDGAIGTVQRYTGGILEVIARVNL